MQKLGKLKTYTSKEVQKSGVSIGFECLDRDVFDPHKCYGLLAQTGAKLARVQTGWAKTENQKGVYDFAWLDDVVDNLLQIGITPWFNVGYGNPLYMPHCPNTTAVGCVPTAYGNDAICAWQNYLHALAKHFGGRVTHYEIWNEPNLPHFWYPDFETASGKKYAELVKMSADSIRSAMPQAKIGANVSNLYQLEYINDLLRNLPPSYLDFYTYHAYGRDFEDQFEMRMNHLKHLLHKHGFENTEIWQGESGFPSWASEGHRMVPEGIDDERPQAVFMLRRYFGDFYHGAKVSSFFQMADMWEKPYEKAVEVQAKPAAHGILNGITYTPKLSYHTFCNVSAILSGDIKPQRCFFYGEIGGADLVQKMSCQYFAYTKDGAPMYAYYLPSPITEHREFENEFCMCIDSSPTEPILIDTLSGEVFAIDEITQKFGFEKYWNLPIRDYPLVVCDKSAIEII